MKERYEMTTAIRTRREFLADNAMGIGSIALAWMLQQEQLLAKPAAVTARQWHTYIDHQVRRPLLRDQPALRRCSGGGRSGGGGRRSSRRLKPLAP